MPASPPSPPPEVYVPTRIPRATMIKDSRLLVESLISGNPGGAAGMNLWDAEGLYDNESFSGANAWHNARNPGGLPYAINRRLWCADLLPQLSSLVVVKDDCGTSSNPAGQGWRARFGGVAITPRHVLYCKHAFTHAQGTWINGNTSNTPPTRLRFIGEDGGTVDRVQLHQAVSANLDLCVAVMDEDLPESVRPARIIPPLESDEYWQLHHIALSQEWLPESGSFQPTASISDYPLHNRQMLYLAGAAFAAPAGDPRRKFLYSVWPGDSGTPEFTVVGGELALSVIVGAANLWALPDAVATLNALIADADAAAIAAERMDAPTGHEAAFLESIHL